MKEKPNIILFITHDQGQFLGSYNTPQNPNTLKTPNLDRMAKSGVRFVNYFCTAPQCSPSRGSVLTSLYPHQNGLMGLVNRGWSLPKSNKTIPMYLKENGYRTHLIGFQHESKNVSTLGYDTVSPRGFEHQYSCTLLENEYFNFFHKHKKSKKPFYLSIGTPEVHRPFIVWGRPVNPRIVKIPPYLPDHKKIREDLAEFYGSIHAVDSTIGKILKCLEVTGLRKDTIFIYTTDHGIAFPRAKCTLYDPGIKTILIMSWPNSDLFQGKVIDSLISNIDLLPTLLDLIGAEIPDNIEGKSFLPILKKEIDSIRPEIYAEKTYHEIYDPMRCVRNQNYKYIRNFKKSKTLYQLPKDIFKDFSGQVMRKRIKKPRMDEELYDLKNDPHEMTNLINNPEYKSVLEDFKQRLNDWMKATKDPLINGFVKPQPRVLKEYHRIEQFEMIYNLILDGIQLLMKNKYLHKIFSKFLRYIPNSSTLKDSPMKIT